MREQRATTLARTALNLLADYYGIKWYGCHSDWLSCLRVSLLVNYLQSHLSAPPIVQCSILPTPANAVVLFLSQGGVSTFAGQQTKISGHALIRCMGHSTKTTDYTFGSPTSLPANVVEVIGALWSWQVNLCMPKELPSHSMQSAHCICFCLSVSCTCTIYRQQECLGNRPICEFSRMCDSHY